MKASTDEQAEFCRRYSNMQELVRCKDCKHRDKEIVPDGAWEGYVFCKKDCAGHKDDWFCADGERK